jgi:hypothetical protein
MHFILGVKPADHEHLFEEVIKAYEEDRMTSWTAPGSVLASVTNSVYSRALLILT